MRFGIMTGTRTDKNHPEQLGGDHTIDEICALAKRIEAGGLDSLWMANVFSLDAIMTMAFAAQQTSRIEVGTAVTPTFPRHPTAIAQQAVTAAAASNNRFTLGIGLAHKIIIEDALGMSYAKPALHMREYLEILSPLLRGEQANFEGKQLTTRGIVVAAKGAGPVPLIVAALGEHMLKLAGKFSDGTNTWMVGPKTIAGHILPTLSAAATAAGRKAPRIIAGYPIVLTNKPDEARAAMAGPLEIYGMLPSYRAMLDREGLKAPEDLAIVGDEAVLREGIKRAEDAGVTDFNAAIGETDAGAFDRTFDFLASL